MIEEVKTIMLELCKEAEWGEGWAIHLTTVVKYVKILAEKLKIDSEIIEVAAWLHDISKIKGDKSKHHVTGVKYAEEILKELNYSEEKIEKVKHCILTHSSDERYEPESIEAKILASADAIAFFDDIFTTAYRVYGVYGNSFEEGKKRFTHKYHAGLKKLLPEAKELIEKRITATRIVFNIKD